MAQGNGGIIGPPNTIYTCTQAEVIQVKTASGCFAATKSRTTSVTALIVAGGGGANGENGQPIGSGGSGIVIVRTPGCVSISVSPGTNSTATRPCGAKVATFTVSGTLTIS